MSLYFQETGKNRDESIIFLHGDGVAGWMWDKQVEAFPDYHCIVVDLPGHGKSSEIIPSTIRDTANLIINIIQNNAHGDKAHLIGLSMGAQVIIQILSTNPDIVNYALITGALVRTTPPTESFLKLLDYLIESYLPVKNNPLYVNSYLRSYNLPKDLHEKFRESTYLIKQDSLNTIIRENMLFEMPDGLENANVPVLVMTGEKDYSIINESAENLISTLPNSKRAYAQGVGHMWPIENPELFNNFLRAWLE